MRRGSVVRKGSAYDDYECKYAKKGVDVKTMNVIFIVSSGIYVERREVRYFLKFTECLRICM